MTVKQNHVMKGNTTKMKKTQLKMEKTTKDCSDKYVIKRGFYWVTFTVADCNRWTQMILND